jgi:ubiquinone/menaquinone biosynthesis C-methylase UbiE
MSWDDQYIRYKHLWGDKPSELAIFAIAYLRRHRSQSEHLNIVDIGCGYGRDALYLLQHTGCRILGIDNSPKAIEMARVIFFKEPPENVEFNCCSFSELTAKEFDLVFISNLYQLLKPNERKELRETIRRILKPSGLAFLSTLSVNDPEHYGKGILAADDHNSFVDEKYLHFCTRLELEQDFSFLDIAELYEHKYEEPRANGQCHHHISWMLAGQYLV